YEHHIRRRPLQIRLHRGFCVLLQCAGVTNDDDPALGEHRRGGKNGPQRLTADLRAATRLVIEVPCCGIDSRGYEKTERFLLSEVVIACKVIDGVERALFYRAEESFLRGACCHGRNIGPLTALAPY